MHSGQDARLAFVSAGTPPGPNPKIGRSIPEQPQAKFWPSHHIRQWQVADTYENERANGTVSERKCVFR